MDKTKILIIDDESRMRKLIGDYLRKNNYEILEAKDGNEGLEIFFSEKGLDLIICDVMMPVIDGYQVVKEIREYSRIPIILLTAKNQEYDELEGFKSGADEYISKPFSPKILVARVEALIKRSNLFQSEGIMEESGIIINKIAHTVTIDEKELDLSAKEFELLEYFLINKGIALSRENILNHVWNYDYYGDVRTIDTHVKKLRNKMGKKGDYIKTIWGMGYKFQP